MSYAVLAGVLLAQVRCAKAPAPLIPPTEPAPPVVVSVPPPIPEELPLERPGSVSEEPGWLGVELAAVEPTHPGVLIRDVMPRSPAAASGLRAGDVLLRVNGETVTSPREAAALLASAGAGRRVNLALRRGTESRLAAAVLRERPDQDQLMRTRFVGFPAPALSRVKLAQGSAPESLTPLRGKVVILEFLAEWCPVCRLLVPVLNDWHRRYTARGAVVIGIAAEGGVARTLHMGRSLGIEYPLLADESGATTLAYHALSLPSLFIVDEQGTVRDVLVGYSSVRLGEVESLVEQLLRD